MSKKLNQEEQLRIQKTRIELLEHSLSNIVKYIKKEINDPIKKEEFLSGVRIYPWNNMPIIDGEVTNIFIDHTKDEDDWGYITILYDKKYVGTLQNYFENHVEFPKKSIDNIRYMIKSMEIDPDNKDMLIVTFAKIEGEPVTVRAKDGDYENTYNEGENKIMKDETFKLFIDDYNNLNTKLNTIINKLAAIELTLGILYQDGPRLTNKQIEEIKSKWEKYKKGE